MATIAVNDLLEAVKDLNELFEEEDRVKANTKSTKEDLFNALEQLAPSLEDGDSLFQSTIDLLIELEYDVPANIKVKKVQAEKKQAANPKGEIIKPKKEAGELSNKAIVYLAWKEGEEDSEKLFSKVKEAVKITTIKGWMNQWKNGKNLPAIVK